LESGAHSPEEHPEVEPESGWYVPVNGHHDPASHSGPEEEPITLSASTPNLTETETLEKTPDEHEQKEEEEEEEDQEEIARRQRIAEKMKKIGGFNPFGPGTQQTQRVQPQPEVEVQRMTGQPKSEATSEKGQSPTGAVGNDEEEEEEAARRRRIAEKMSKIGGFNPFGAPAPTIQRKVTNPLPSPLILEENPKKSGEEELIAGVEEEEQSTPEVPDPETGTNSGASLSDDDNDTDDLPDLPPPPVPSRHMRRSHPLIPAHNTTEPARFGDDDDEDEAHEDVLDEPEVGMEEEREENIPPPVPKRISRPIPPAPITPVPEASETTTNKEDSEEVPPSLPSRISRPNPPPANELTSPSKEKALPVRPEQTSVDPSLPSPLAITATNEVEEDDEDAISDSETRRGAVTPIPKRSSFMDFSEDVEDVEDVEEEEEEAPPPPPPRRPSVPVPAAPVAKPTTSPSQKQIETVVPQLPPYRPTPAAPPAPEGRVIPFLLLIFSDTERKDHLLQFVVTRQNSQS
jgi:hypothetical protein